MTSIEPEDRIAPQPAFRSLASALIAALLAIFLFSGCSVSSQTAPDAQDPSTTTSEIVSDSSTSEDTNDESDAKAITGEDASQNTTSPNSLSNIGDYAGQDVIEIAGGKPAFTDEEMLSSDGLEVYGPLDQYGRATTAFANLCTKTRPIPGSKRAKNMPDPSGWNQAKYPEIGLDHLYERSHLIAYSLSDEAVNPLDLITGTEYLNQHLMSKYEDKIRDYLDPDTHTGSHQHHVLMRVTPDFRGSELVARGVQIEALSLDDGGRAICMNVYCYNVQPGVAIDYATGASHLEQQAQNTTQNEKAAERSYVVNKNTRKFHVPDCSSVRDMKAKNRSDVEASRDDLIAQGYKPCARCNP